MHLEEYGTRSPRQDSPVSALLPQEGVSAQTCRDQQPPVTIRTEAPTRPMCQAEPWQDRTGP
jgi:hypothetical protein